MFGLHAGQSAVAVGVQIDTASRIVVAGGYIAGARSCIIARFLPDGSRDPSFGASGVVRQSVGQSVCWYNDLALQNDGRIVAFGEIDGHTRPRALLSRYLPDGSLDPTFGDGGIVLFSSSPITSAMAVVIDAEQRILIAGQAEENGTAAFFTRRYQSDGSVDLSFGDNGQAQGAFITGRDIAYDLSIQADGKILVVGGAVSPDSGLSDFGIVRYLDDGSRDMTFGSMGLLTLTLGPHSEATGVALDSLGRSIVAGAVEQSGAIVRLLEDGSLDPSFAADGTLVESSPAALGYSSVAVVTDDTILAVGTSMSGTGEIAVSRYLPDGQRDYTFGTNGFAQSLPLPYRQVGWDIAGQSDGRVVVVGGYGNNASFDMLVARYCR